MTLNFVLIFEIPGLKENQRRRYIIMIDGYYNSDRKVVPKDDRNRILMDGNFVSKHQITNSTGGGPRRVCINFDAQRSNTIITLDQIVRANNLGCSEELKFILEQTYKWCVDRCSKWQNKCEGYLTKKKKEEEKEKLLEYVRIQQEKYGANIVNASANLISKIIKQKLQRKKAIQILQWKRDEKKRIKKKI